MNKINNIINELFPVNEVSGQTILTQTVELTSSMGNSYLFDMRFDLRHDILNDTYGLHQEFGLLYGKKNRTPYHKSNLQIKKMVYEPVYCPLTMEDVEKLRVNDATKRAKVVKDIFKKEWDIDVFQSFTDWLKNGIYNVQGTTFSIPRG